MNATQLAKSSAVGTAVLERTFKQKFLAPVLIGVCFFLLILENISFKPIKLLKSLVNDTITYSAFIINLPVNFTAQTSKSFLEFFNFNIHQQNKILQDQVNKLISEKNELLFFKNENDNLKRTLGIRNQGEYAALLVKVIKEDTSEFGKSFSITKGLTENLEIGQAVVRNNVYLGRISEVNILSSKVMIVTDAGSRIPIVIPSKGVNAILKGDGYSNVELLFLPPSASLDNNDQIYTSGTDGIIKEGLYVGKVIVKEDKNKKKKYSIDLGFKEHQLNYVSVLKLKR